MRILFTSLLLWFAFFVAHAQQNNYKIGLIGFYNLENLFDTINQPDVLDDDFTPTGANRYTGKVYLDKLSKLERVISEMGVDKSHHGIAVLGVAEIENRSVLEDLVNMPKLRSRFYQIVHYDSKDARGIDVALLYNPKYFKPLHSEPLFVPTYRADSSIHYTRDVLYVAGMFDGEPLHIFVNHWPSRRGGEDATRHLRELAASVNKQKIDSIITTDNSAKIIVMGDLNDNPTNSSVTKVLNAKRYIKDVTSPEAMFNPFMDFYKKGIGTLAWNDTWSLFDQIIVSHSFLNREQQGYFFQEAAIFKKEYMLQKTGRFKGYPLRTYVGSSYMGGYSDHFPAYIILLKKN